ncbi:MAG TPA: hypothetical protein VHB49_06235 [Bradyrhizobium sp.]|nr:hypothetical protein [Bradyrhizobium sp.]
MTKLKLLGAAALVVSSALAGPAMAQQMAAKPGRCSQFDPNCQNVGAAAPYNHNYQRRVAYRTPRGHLRNREAWRNQDMRNEDMRNGWHNPGWHAASTDGYWTRRDNDPFFWPGDVAAGVVGGAVATAGAAVNTAGAIATAPFRNYDSYAYYNGGYYNNGWDNNWDRRTYAQRNGFVCQPGTWFKGDDGRRHICQ